MTTVGEFICPISLERMQGKPVILESCFHTFSRESLVGQVRSKLEERIGRLDLRVLELFECPMCKTPTRLEDLVINDEWQRVDAILKRWQEAYPEEDADSQKFSDLYHWDLDQRFATLSAEWQHAHLGQKGSDLIVEDYLRWKMDPLVKNTVEEWKKAFPDKSSDLLPLEDLISWKLESCKSRPIEAFQDIRPLHLLGCTAETHEAEKVKKARSRRPLFPEETWSYTESLKFIASAVYHFSLALFAEVGLFLLYLWECAFLTTEQYHEYRTTHVIRRLTPIYFKYMGIPPEEATA